MAHTAAKTGFSQRIIEKDYFCSLALHELAAGFEQGLVFKGGTCLSKVHVGFSRLSEDLDFMISTAERESRRQRQESMKPIKRLIESLSISQAGLQTIERLQAHNESRQYIGKLAYSSAVSGQDETIVVEISLRERVLTEPIHCRAKTLLVDPNFPDETSGDPWVTALSVAETYAEKLRAALTRKEPKIRDYFDIAAVLSAGLIDLQNELLLSLVREKLSVPGNQAIPFSQDVIEALSRQVDTELRPVLRPSDFASFDLSKVYVALDEFSRRLAVPN